MKIKLAILEKDTSYLNRFISVFSTKYADKMEMYSFTDMNVALTALDANRIDVLIVSDSFEVDVEALPKRCGFAYFVESANVESVNEQRAICKFQKIDLIYKQILSLYAENANRISDFKVEEGATKVVAFTSPSGGVGCSTLAAACALHYAAQGKKVLYLNLERYGSADRFFAAEGQFDMSDVIFAIKSKKANLAIKLESCVKYDPRGVYFFSETKNAMDMLELENEECAQLISELRISGTYEYIVLDVDFMVGKDMIELYRKSDKLILVGDGSDISNGKLLRAHQVFTTLEAKMETPLASKSSLIYNKFSSKTSTMIEGVELKMIAGVAKIEGATTQQILGHIAENTMYDRIFA